MTISVTGKNGPSGVDDPAGKDIKARRNYGQVRCNNETRGAHSVVSKVPIQVSLLGNRDVAQTEPKATEQVAYLLRQIQKKGQIFLPLEQVHEKNSTLVFRENKCPPENNAGTVVFSKNGFVSVAKD